MLGRVWATLAMILCLSQLPWSPVADIAISGGSIQFTIQVAEEEYFARPVPLRYRGAEHVPRDQYEPWGHGIREDPRLYQGMVNANSIVLDVDGRERVFSRVGS